MTVFRNNPLLMTVMGANPGPRRKRPVDDPVDRAIGQIWARLMSGVQVPIMDIPRIFRDIKLEIAGGMSIEEAVMRVGQRFQVNPRRLRRNPSLGASLAGGMAGAFVTHALSNPKRGKGTHPTQHDVPHNSEFCNKCAHEAYCEVCRGSARRNPGPAFIVIDSKSGIVQYRRAASGTGSQAYTAAYERARDMAQKLGRSFFVFLDMHSTKVGAQLALPMVRVMGATEVFPSGPGSRTQKNPLTEIEHRQLIHDARHDDGMANHFSDKGNRFGEGIYRGRASRGRELAHNLSPKSNPGPNGRRKVTMTIEKFAQWVKAKRDPAMWKAFLAKFRGYEKWTHGAKGRKVTLEWQNVPGMSGLWITYDGGKQPESTYIMPSGSPRKGAWKHPWDTMPDIKHDPEAGVVLTKLRGKSKITDFYHL